jgi:hypothetical protein
MDRIPKFNKPMFKCIRKCGRTTGAPDKICSSCRYKERKRVENFFASQILFFQKQAERYDMEAKKHSDALEQLKVEKKKYADSVDNYETTSECYVSDVLDELGVPKSDKKPARKGPLKKKDFVLNEAQEDNRPEKEIEREADQNEDGSIFLKANRKEERKKANKKGRGDKIQTSRDAAQGQASVPPAQNSIPPSIPPLRNTIVVIKPKPQGPKNDFHATDSDLKPPSPSTSARDFMDGLERNYGIEEMDVVRALDNKSDEDDDGDLIDLDF